MKIAAFTLAIAAVASARTPAFPGATGAGMFATGGRGGTVVHVINLNGKGPGSFAEAVSEGNRIVVFDVSGIIDLTERKDGKVRGGRVDISHPNITVAGQTAPGEGIFFKGGTLHVSAECHHPASAFAPRVGDGERHWRRHRGQAGITWGGH